MKCPYCGEVDSKVIDSRPTEDGEKIRRRRECLNCKKRFTTYEIVETVPRPLLAVGVKKGVPVVHAPQLAQHPRAVKQPFGQCSFAAVHMCQQPDDQTFHTRSP